MNVDHYTCGDHFDDTGIGDKINAAHAGCFACQRLLSLVNAGMQYAEAKRAWAETFLFYYTQPGGKKPRTVAEAQAMADVEVNVTEAMIKWEVERLAYQPKP